MSKERVYPRFYKRGEPLDLKIEELAAVLAAAYNSHYGDEYRETGASYKRLPAVCKFPYRMQAEAVLTHLNG